MKCPICKAELRRSKKDPNYGLCDNCRKKFKWEDDYEEYYEDEDDYYDEEPVSRRTTNRTSSKRHETRFKTPRLVIGIISIILFVLVSLQSCVAGLGNALADSGEVSGSAGFLLAVCMLIAGIVTICLRKRDSVASFAVPGGFFFVGSILAAANVGSYGDLAIWSILAAIFSAVHFILMFLCMETNKIITFAVPIVILIIIIAFVSVSKKSDSAEPKSTTNNSSTEQLDDGKTDDTTVPEDDDGVINFDGEGYNVTYVRHEISTDYEGNQCLLFYYNFTNNGEDNTSALASSYIQVFQNGVALETTILGGDNASINNYMTDVQPGTTIEVCQAYKISDMSDVTVEAADLISFDDRKDTQTIQLQ